MKIRNDVVLLAAVLTASLLAGCFAHEAAQKLDAVENRVEEQLDTWEDTIEKAVLPPQIDEPKIPAASMPSAEPAPQQQSAPSPAPVPSEPSAVPSAPKSDYISAEEAKAIALQYAGFAADQVEFLRAEFDVDDRIPQYDIEFHQARWEYNYEIHAETGAVLSFEKDD